MPRLAIPLRPNQPVERAGGQQVQAGCVGVGEAGEGVHADGLDAGFNRAADGFRRVLHHDAAFDGDAKLGLRRRSYTSGWACLWPHHPR